MRDERVPGNSYLARFSSRLGSPRTRPQCDIVMAGGGKLRKRKESKTNVHNVCHTFAINYCAPINCEVIPDDDDDDDDGVQGKTISTDFLGPILGGQTTRRGTMNDAEEEEHRSRNRKYPTVCET